MSTEHPDYLLFSKLIGEISDLRAVGQLLSWDQNTKMPLKGDIARAQQRATLSRLSHERSTSKQFGDCLDRLVEWAEGLDPNSDEARAVQWARRDYEKAVKVPAELIGEMTELSGIALGVWKKAKANSDFKLFRDHLARQFELAQRYASYFPECQQPYDALLDNYEPGLTTAQVTPIFDNLAAKLAPLVLEAAESSKRTVTGIKMDESRQRELLLQLLPKFGYDPDRWRLDVSTHPFAAGLATDDVRITTTYRREDFDVAFYSTLHEFGHGLYEANIDPTLSGFGKPNRTGLGHGVSLGVHESQSRFWENFIGRSLPFCEWLIPELQRFDSGVLTGQNPESLFRAINGVQPSLIRIFADETTYNQHVILRFRLESALINDGMSVDDLPQRWASEMDTLLGVEVPDDANGVLQDTHWSIGAIGYFPTYSIGNLMAAQLWDQMRVQMPSIDEMIAAGQFGEIAEWLRSNIHRHGAKFTLNELLTQVTGRELESEPFERYIRSRLEQANLIGVSSATH